MLMLAAAIAATASVAPPPHRWQPTRAVTQATATVRIISGVRLKLDAPRNAGAPPARDKVITADGTPRRARLIEFE